jgi:exopolyphosphatase/guanosine-5'-triphosphate,3'-diphosphate pyrophosphatase
MMRLASIDIGTNTILMLIADVERNGILSVVRDEHSIARLGKGVDEHGFIQKETFQRVQRILLKFKSIADSNEVQHLAACGTSALRDAANRQEFLDFIREHLSIDIKILSGREEAESTYVGAVSEYLEGSPSGEFAVLDIGGGSTELVAGTGSNVSSAVSIDIGSVRLTERILKNNPPDNIALENAVKLVQHHLRHISPLPSATVLVGVAGTLTTLAALDLQLKTFDKTLINRYVLTRETIERIFQELRHLTLDEIRSYPQIHHSRADILLAGILILREILHKVNVSQITVSDRGLRYGIVLQTARMLLNA